MPRSCSVCSHPDRASIDEDLVAGRGSLRNVAVRYGTTAPTLLRHEAHLPGTIALARQAREATRADDLLGLLREAARDARRLRDKAEDEGDLRCAVAAVKTLCDVVEKLADIGERLAKSGAEEPRTLAEFMRKIATSEQARGGEAPLKVEWVNDWRAPGVAPSTYLSERKERLLRRRSGARVCAQAPCEQLSELVWHPSRWLYRSGPHDGGDGLCGCRASKRTRPAEHLVEDAAEREHVRGWAQLPYAPETLGGHVRRRPMYHTRGRHRQGVACPFVLDSEGPGQTEVDELHAGVGEKEDVARFHVPVKDSVFMERVEADEERSGDPEHTRPRHWGDPSEVFLERLAVEEL